MENSRMALGRLSFKRVLERPDDETIDFIDCKWVKRLDIKNRDIHLVKEHIYLKNGTAVKFLRVIEDYKRPFWLDPRRNSPNVYKQKKEYMKASYLTRYESTEKDLWKSIGMRLGKVGKNATKRNFEDNPYIYGTDIPSESFIKEEYNVKYGKHDIGNDYAVFDIEARTDGTEVLMVSVVRKGALFIVANKNLYQHETKSEQVIIEEVITSVREKFKVIPDIDKYKIKVVIGSEVDCLTMPIELLHRWSPDVVAAWNARYDMTELTKRQEAHGLDIEAIWSDPWIDESLRYFRIQLGADGFITAGDVYKNRAPEEKWDVFHTASAYHIVDGMQVFKTIRKASEGKSPGGYGIDNIAKRFTNIGKLQSEDPKARALVGKLHHDYMVRYRPIEYTVYGGGDSLIMEYLYQKIPDLEFSISIFSGNSPWRIFNSSPKRLADVYFNFCYSQGYIMGNARSQKDIEQEDPLLGRIGWTKTLQAHYRAEPGVGLLNYDGVDNRTDTNVADLDQSSGYPSDTIAIGMGVDTTLNEIKSMDGITIEDMKQWNKSLVYGRANHIAYAEDVFNLPNIMEVVKKEKAKQ